MGPEEEGGGLGRVDRGLPQVDPHAGHLGESMLMACCGLDGLGNSRIGNTMLVGVRVCVPLCMSACAFKGREGQCREDSVVLQNEYILIMIHRRISRFAQ